MNKLKEIIKKNAIGWIMLLPAVFCIAFVYWSPIFEGITKSFFGSIGYETTDFVGLKNYIDVLSDTLFIKTFLNTVKYVLWSLLIGFVPPILLAFLLNEVKFINKAFRVMTYLPYLVPTVALTLIWKQMYSPGSYGMLNSILLWLKLPASDWLQNSSIAIPLLIIMMTWQGTPGSAVIYLAKMQETRADLYEAALIDGAGLWKRFTTVTWPTISSTALLLTIRQIIGVFQVMEQPLLMTGGGPDNATMSLNLTAYNYAFTYMNVSKSLALGVCAFLMLISLTVIYFRLEKKMKDRR